MSAQPETNKGYMMDVVLEYPNELHDSHSGYPFAPETKHVADVMRSSYSRKLWTKWNPKTKLMNETKKRMNTPKVLTILEDNNKYVCDYRNLQLHITLDTKLKKINRVL